MLRGSIYQENEQDRGMYTDAAKMRILGPGIYASLFGAGEIGNWSYRWRSSTARGPITTQKPRPSRRICIVVVPEW